MLIVACTFLALWGYSCLEIVLWLTILKFLSTVKLARFLLKVFFHHIEVIFIVLLVNTGVAPNQDTKLVKRLGNELALLFHLNWVLFKESFDINHWYFR